MRHFWWKSDLRPSTSRGSQCISRDIPELPWPKAGADIFEISGQSFFLLVGDDFSKFPEVLNIRDKTTRTVISQLKSVLARVGIPKEIVCDLVPFASLEMREFAAADSWTMLWANECCDYCWLWLLVTVVYYSKKGTQRRWKDGQERKCNWMCFCIWTVLLE